MQNESTIQAKVRLDASKLGWRLWRNNVGVLMDSRGVPVRFGLANDSAGVNKIIKSADLIGIRPVIITQDMVGKVIGQFVRHADAFNSVLWVGGEWSIFVLRSSVKPA